ncbi:CBS domain-containing protein [Flavobacteriaceae bacterium]|nr:CBS domain-containing protein [Flavobacteriaceae bacterium]
MKKREPVSHIMTPDPYVLNLNDGLSHAEILFKKHTVRHLHVVSGDEIVGILSRTDLARISFVDSYDPNDFFTLEEYPVYKTSASALNKRMMTMAIERLKDQAQSFAAL